MSILLTFSALLFLALGLMWYTAARTRQSLQNAALLAQLDAMDANLTRFERESQVADRELRKLERRQRPMKLKPTVESKIDSAHPNTTTVPPSASPVEAPNPNPKQKRRLPRAPRQSKVDQINTECLAPAPPVATQTQPHHRVRIAFSLAPLRFAVTLLHTLAAPIFRVTSFFTTLLIRKKPPPQIAPPPNENDILQNRAA